MGPRLDTTLVRLVSLVVYIILLTFYFRTVLANPGGARLSSSATYRAAPLLPSLTEGVGAASVRRVSSMGVYSSASGTGFGSGASRRTSLLPPIPSGSDLMDDMGILNTPNSASTRSLTRRLSAMPALPLQGATKEAQDEEEDDEEEDGDDEDEEETENEHEQRDADDENTELSRSSCSSERSYASGINIAMQSPSSSSSTESSISIQPQKHPEERHKNTNASYTAEDDSDEVSNSSAYETAHSRPSSARPSRQNSRQNSLSSKSFSTAPDHLHDHHDNSNGHHLPPIDFGSSPGLGKLDFSFLNQPPSASLSNKGKARMSLVEEAGRTPTAGKAGSKSKRPKQDGHAQTEVVPVLPETEDEEYFGRVMHPRPQPYYRSMSEQTVQRGSRKISPSRTPRPGDHHISFSLNPSLVGSSRPPSSSSSGLGLPSFGMTLAGSLSRSSSMMSQSSGGAYINGNGNPNLGPSRVSSLSRHSGMYKMASKSLIDVHALEKREEVERIVWEEEEKAERRMVKTRHSKGGYQDKEASDGEFFFSFQKGTRRYLIINI